LLGYDSHFSSYQWIKNHPIPKFSDGDESEMKGLSVNFD